MGRETPEALHQQAKSNINNANSMKNRLMGKTEEMLTDAVEQLEKAANLYSAAEQDELAAKTFEEAASVYENKLNDTFGANVQLTKAVNIYRQISPPDAVRCLHKSIELATPRGDNRKLATLNEDLGKQYEQSGDFAKAKIAYFESSKQSRKANSPAAANKTADKAAELTATAAQAPEDYQVARDTFVTIAKSNVDSNTLRFGVKTTLFKAGLCSLGFGDVVTARNDFNHFKSIDREFAQSREYALLEELAEDLEDKDAEKWNGHVQAFARTFPLTAWQQDIIGRQEDALREAENDFS